MFVFKPINQSCLSLNWKIPHSLGRAAFDRVPEDAQTSPQRSCRNSTLLHSWYDYPTNRVHSDWTWIPAGCPPPGRASVAISATLANRKSVECPSTSRPKWPDTFCVSYATDPGWAAGVVWRFLWSGRHRAAGDCVRRYVKTIGHRPDGGKPSRCDASRR